jgi:hypothetical protein
MNGQWRAVSTNVVGRFHALNGQLSFDTKTEQWPFGRWGAQTYTLNQDLYMFSGQTMIVDGANDGITNAQRSRRYLLNDLWKLSRCEPKQILLPSCPHISYVYSSARNRFLWMLEVYCLLPPATHMVLVCDYSSLCVVCCVTESHRRINSDSITADRDRPPAARPANDNVPDQWLWSQQRACMQNKNAGFKATNIANNLRVTEGFDTLTFPGPRTGAATWTAKCCVVGGGPKLPTVGHAICNAAKYKNFQAEGRKCAHQVEESLFMFGGVGLMESPTRNPSQPAHVVRCLLDEAGDYVSWKTRNKGWEPRLDVTSDNGATEWQSKNNTKSWVADAEWELYNSLCDLWQADSAQHWVLLGACESGLQSPINRGVQDSMAVSAINSVPFPDAIMNAGIYKASSWADDVGNLWLFGGFVGNLGAIFGPLSLKSLANSTLLACLLACTEHVLAPTGDLGYGPKFDQEIGREFSPGGTLCSDDLWYYDPVAKGSWEHVIQQKPNRNRINATEIKAAALLPGADRLPDFSWPRLGKCGAVAWQPWVKPLWRDSGDPQVRDST